MREVAHWVEFAYICVFSGILVVTTVSQVSEYYQYVFTHRAPYLKHTSSMFVHSICGTTSNLIPCPNKLIPQLTCKSKVQGQMQIPEKQTVANLAVNQLITQRVTQFVMLLHTTVQALPWRYTHTRRKLQTIYWFTFKVKCLILHVHPPLCLCVCISQWVSFSCVALFFLCWPPAPVLIWFTPVPQSCGRGGFW